MAVQHIIHNVGSYPADTAELAMRDMIEICNGALLWVSDGETGERRDWVVNHIETYRSNPAFELVQDGKWTSYDDVPTFRVKPGHTLMPNDFKLQYYEHAMQSWATFKKLRAEYNRPDLRFQVGIPHALDMSLFTFGLEQGLDPVLQEAYAQATIDQITAIREKLGDDVIFQLETPASLSVSFMPPEMLPPALLPDGLAENLRALMERMPSGTDVGVHLCVGDLGNKARLRPASRKVSVALANAIAHFHPKNGKLLYIHEPVAAGDQGAVLEESAYDDLRDLHLKNGTYYIAGFVHESQSIEEQKRVMQWIIERLPKEQLFGVSTACGMGRRPLTVARDLLQREAVLVS